MLRSQSHNGLSCSGKFLSFLAETLLIVVVIGTLFSSSQGCAEIEENARTAINLVSGGTVLLLLNLVATMMAFVYVQQNKSTSSVLLQQRLFTKVSKFTCAVAFPFTAVFFALVAFPSDFCLTDDVHICLAGAAATVTAQAVYEMAILPTEESTSTQNASQRVRISTLPDATNPQRSGAGERPAASNSDFKNATASSGAWNLQVFTLVGFSLSSFLGAFVDYRLRGCLMLLMVLIACIECCKRATRFLRAKLCANPTTSHQLPRASRCCFLDRLPRVTYSFVRIRSRGERTVADAFGKLSFILAPTLIIAALSMSTVSANALGCSLNLMRNPLFRSFPLGSLWVNAEQTAFLLTCGNHAWFHVTHPASRSISFLALGISCTSMCFTCGVVWSQVFMASIVSDLTGSRARSQAMLRWLSHECRSPAAAATLALEAVIDDLCPQMEAMAAIQEVSSSSGQSASTFAQTMQEGKRMLRMAQIPLQTLGATLDNMLNFMQHEAGVVRSSTGPKPLSVDTVLAGAWSQSIGMQHTVTQHGNVQCSLEVFEHNFKCKESGGRLEFPACEEVCEQLRLRASVSSATVSQVLTNFLTNALKYGQNASSDVDIAIKLSLIRGNECFCNGKFTKLADKIGDGNTTTWLPRIDSRVETTDNAASLGVDDAMCIVSVTDRGQGLSQDEQASLFQPFSRLRRGSHMKGHGLGLWLMKQLVQQQGGVVHVHSSGIGFGSTFSIAFPVSLTEECRSATGASSKNLPAKSSSDEGSYIAQLAGLQILLVDDSVVVRKMVARVLLKAGCIVTEAADGGAALKTLTAALGNQTHFDVLVTDMTMPVLSGDELCQKVCELYDARATHATCGPPRTVRGRKPLVIGITGNALEADVRLFRDSGADHVLIKPVKGAELLRTLSAVTTRHHDTTQKA